MPIPTTYDFATEDFAGAALHRKLALLREQGPVTAARFGGQPAVLISSHRALEAMEQEGLARIAHELVDRLGKQRSADPPPPPMPWAT